MRRLLPLLVVVTLVASCGDTASTAPTVGDAPPTTGRVADPCPLEEPMFPVIIVTPPDSMTVVARPQRIVSMSATHTEMLYAIGAGDQVAGTDLTSDYPAAANDTAKIDSFAFNLEEVLALDPDLVLLAFDFSGEVEALRSAGVAALLLPPAADLDEMVQQFEIVGQATGNSVAACEEVNRLRDEINDLIEGYERPLVRPLTFFHEVDETLFSVNSNTFLGDIYARFGLVNIADEAPDEFGSGFPQLSAEFVLEADPDVIFLGDAGFGVTADSLVDRPGWGSLSAVGSGAVFELDTDIAGRWGPRTDEVVRQIASALESLR